MTVLTDFIYHNKRSLVVHGCARPGGGAIYTLATGTTYELTPAMRDQLPPTFPRWRLRSVDYHDPGRLADLSNWRNRA